MQAADSRDGEESQVHVAIMGRGRKTKSRAATGKECSQLSAEQCEVLQLQVSSIVSGVLGKDDVDTEMPLMDAGIDSLGAVELRNAL